MQPRERFLELKHELIDTLTSWINGTFYMPPEAMASVLEHAIHDIALYRSSGLGGCYFYLKCNDVIGMMSFAIGELRSKRTFTCQVSQAVEDAVRALEQLQVS
jgi:hypothetical protein